MGWFKNTKKVFRLNFAKSQQVWFVQVAGHRSEPRARLRASSAPHRTVPQQKAKTQMAAEKTMAEAPTQQKTQPLKH